MKILHIKQQFLEYIIEGRKKFEVRVGYPNIRKIKPGDHIQLVSESLGHLVLVKDVRCYQTFAEMLDAENGRFIAPDTATREELLDRLKEIYPPEKEKLGVIVLEIDTG